MQSVHGFLRTISPLDFPSPDTDHPHPSASLRRDSFSLLTPLSLCPQHVTGGPLMPTHGPSTRPERKTGTVDCTRRCPGPAVDLLKRSVAANWRFFLPSKWGPFVMSILNKIVLHKGRCSKKVSMWNELPKSLHMSVRRKIRFLVRKFTKTT